MSDFYVTRVPLGSAWGLPGRARHPLLKLVFMVFALVSFVVLLAVALVVLIVDIILLPFRLIFRAL